MRKPLCEPFIKFAHDHDDDEIKPCSCYVGHGVCVATRYIHIMERNGYRNPEHYDGEDKYDDYRDLQTKILSDSAVTVLSAF